MEVVPLLGAGDAAAVVVKHTRAGYSGGRAIASQLE